MTVYRVPRASDTVIADTDGQVSTYDKADDAWEPRGRSLIVGSVSTFADLPAAPTEGQTFVVRDEIALYTWDGTDWTGPVPVQGAATEAAVAAVVTADGPTRAALDAAFAGRTVDSLPAAEVIPGGDMTAKIQAGLDALPAAEGGTFTLPTRPHPYRVDGQIIIGPRKALHLPSGVELVRSPAHTPRTDPMIVLNGNHARLTGEGLVRSDNDHPNGIVMVGPTTITKATYTASTTSGSTTLSAAAGTFSADDVGKTITVWTAGSMPGVGPAKLVTTIAAFVDTATVTLVDPAGSTATDDRAYWGEVRGVAWAQVGAVRIRGAETPGSSLLYFNSSPQGAGALTAGCDARATQLERGAYGVHFGPQANGNSCSGVQVQRITDSVYYFRDAVENTVTGGFVHFSLSLKSIVKGRWAIYNIVRGVAGEPGSGRPCDFDDKSSGNSVDLMANTTQAYIDDGVQNTIWMRDQFIGQRVHARDGLTLPITSGAVTDALFRRAPQSGTLALDTSALNRLFARVGSVWKYVKMRTRHVTEIRNRDFPSIPAHSTVEMTVAIADAATGDAVTVTPTGGVPAGLTWCGYVSTPGTVVIRVGNVTSAPIDPPSLQWILDVFSRD